MKKITLLLTILLVLALASCGIDTPAADAESTDTGSPAGNTETAETSAPSASGNGTFGNESFDVPKTMDEVRARTIAYFDAMSAVKWIAPETMDYRDDCPWTTKLVYDKNQTYYGLPYSTYIQPGVGLEEFTDYLDAKSVYTGPLEYKKLIGGDCGSPRRAWAYGGALCGYGMTYDVWEYFVGQNIKENKQPVIVKVGDYDDSHFTEETSTFECIMNYNTAEALYEGYAKLKACDFIGHRFKLSGGTIAQHIQLIVDDATVYRLGNGKIAPSKSYLTYSEQTSTVHTVDGKKTTWLLSQQISFTDLYAKGYIPMSIVSLQTDTVTPVEMTVTGLSKPENFGTSPVLKGTVKCNYNIFKLEAVITDKDGNTVSSGKYYPYGLSALASEIELSMPVKELPAGDYHFKLNAVIGFGEKAVADFDFKK